MFFVCSTSGLSSENVSTEQDMNRRVPVGTNDAMVSDIALTQQHLFMAANNSVRIWDLNTFVSFTLSRYHARGPSLLNTPPPPLPITLNRVRRAYAG